MGQDILPWYINQDSCYSAIWHSLLRWALKKYPEASNTGAARTNPNTGIIVNPITINPNPKINKVMPIPNFDILSI
jgi:hypothetical protein